MSLIQHEIETEDSHPIRLTPYRAPISQRQNIEDHLDKMLHNDVISPSNSPWSAPVVIVRKKDVTDRFCVDYRRLNAVNKKTATLCYASRTCWMYSMVLSTLAPWTCLVATISWRCTATRARRLPLQHMLGCLNLTPCLLACRTHHVLFRD